MTKKGTYIVADDISSELQQLEDSFVPGQFVPVSELPVVNKLIEDVGELADAHWEYVKETILAHANPSEEVLKASEYHYKSAFVHGYKHGKEDR